MKIFVPILLVASLLLITSSLASVTTVSGGDGSVAPPPTTEGPAIEKWCGGKCDERCKLAGMKDRCLKYCGICCKECKCVPSGTYGNKDECPCYRDKLSSKGTPKCP